jgi:DNA-binding NarL/FixJ family response regulator
MIRVLVIADSGAAMATITASLALLPEVHIAGYASGVSRVDRILHGTPVDVVLVDEMARSGLALARVAEIREAHPAAAIVGLTARPESGWARDGLRAGAAAVVPRDLAAAVLGAVLHDVLHVEEPLAA